MIKKLYLNGMGRSEYEWTCMWRFVVIKSMQNWNEGFLLQTLKTRSHVIMHTIYHASLKL